MKILLKAQTCLPLPPPLGFTPHLFPSPPTHPLCPHCERTVGSRPSVSELAQGTGKGLQTALALDGLLGSLLSCAGCGGGACVHSHQAGGLTPLPGPLPAIVLPPLRFPHPTPPLPSLGHVDAPVAYQGAPVLPAPGLSLWPPGTK